MFRSIAFRTKQKEMMHEEILKAADTLLKANEAIEMHEMKYNSQLQFSSDLLTKGQELRSIDLIDAALKAEKIFIETVRSTQQSGMWVTA